MKKKFLPGRVGLLWLLLFVGGLNPVFSFQKESVGTTVKLSKKEREQLVKERMEERKRLKKEKEAEMKKKKKEKEKLAKQKQKEKKEQQKQLVKLKEEKMKLLQEEKKNAKKQTAKVNAPKKDAPPLVAALPEKENPPVRNPNDKDNKVSRTAPLQTVVANEGALPQKTQTSEQPALKNKAVIRELRYDFPAKEMLDEGFLKSGKLYQFHIKGLNPRLYNITINGETYAAATRVDPSLLRSYDYIKELPIGKSQNNLHASLVSSAAWGDYLKQERYVSSKDARAYRDYVTDFTDIKTELKKEAVSYKDFVGVLEVNAAKKLPMQYELLDTTFYKSYYLLFVSRVDLLRDYYTAFLNQMANLDTIRYKEVMQYQSTIEQSIERFVKAKKNIYGALDILGKYVRAIGEYQRLLYTDPEAYDVASIKKLKTEFLNTFEISIEADSSGLVGISNTIRAKINQLRLTIQSNLAAADKEFKALQAYLIHTQDYSEVYIKKHKAIMQSLEQMNRFVDKELSLQNRNIRFSEIVENLYRRLMLAYEQMKNDIKDNADNMYAKVKGLNDFLATDLNYDRVQQDYKQLLEGAKWYLPDSLYTKLSFLATNIYAYVGDSLNFDIASKIQRIPQTDFVDYAVDIRPRKNLPANMVLKYGAFSENFRFPVYGGFVHTLSLGLGLNLSFTQAYRLTPVNAVNGADNTTDNYRIVGDGGATKAKLHIAAMYHFFYRAKNPNVKYGGGVGLLLDLTNLIDLSRTKVLLGPSLLFYDRFVLTAGITLGAEPKLQNSFQPNQVLSLQNNLNNDINDVRGKLHSNAFAVGAFINLGISLFN